MNPTILIGAAFVLLVGAGAYWYVHSQRPRHLFYAIDFGQETIQPYIRKTLKGNLSIPGPQGKKVQFPVDTNWSLNRQDGKGSVMFGDVATGQLVKPTPDGKWLSMDGIFLEAALVDGRVESLARSTNAGMLELKHILYAVLGVGALIILVVYQFAKGGF